MSDRVDPQVLYDYLRQRGVDHVHAMGMLANIEGESAFHPGIRERHPIRGRGGYGLFQHTGPRRRALEAYCRDTGREIWDWRAQIDYTMTEPDTDHYLDKHFETTEDAMAWFVRHWERPAHPERDVHKRSAYLAQLETMVRPTTA